MCFQSIMCVRSDGYVLDVVEMCVRVVRCAKTAVCKYVALKRQVYTEQALGEKKYG